MDLSLLLIVFLTFPLLLFLLRKHKTFKNQLPFPPGPRGLPIIGNLHQLDRSNLYIQLWQLSKKFGPIFSLQLGLKKAIVISSPSLVKEIMKTHDLAFCGRPKLHGQQKLSYNGLGITFSPYNDYWREIRKFCVAHIFSTKRVSSFSSIRQFEVKQMIKKISRHASSSKATNLNETLISLTSTIICRIAFGRRFEDEGVERSRFYELLKELQAMCAIFFVSDYIPFLGWIDRLTGLHARLERIFKELDKFYEQVINEHMDPCRKTNSEEDIIDILLQLKEQNSFSVYLTYDHIKGVFMDILAAATDTTAATTVWAMTALIKNPRVMKKAQEEIRRLGGNKDFLDENDVNKLSYLKAVIKEVLRLHLPAPLLVPRETNQMRIINGYEIHAKTLVFVNAWAIHRDPKTWNDPLEFCPERFLDNKNNAIDFRGQDFEFIPFGAGRRICPGIGMAVAALDLIIANLLYSFDWELPKGLTKDDIDTDALIGVTQHKKNPLYLVAKNTKG